MGVALTVLLEETMPVSSRELSSGQCAYCGEPLAFNGAGVEAWRVGNQFVCNEFCADGIPDEPASTESAAS
jgi:hypothetical protein